MEDGYPRLLLPVWTWLSYTYVYLSICLRWFILFLLGFTLFYRTVGIIGTDFSTVRGTMCLHPPTRSTSSSLVKCQVQISRVQHEFILHVVLEFSLTVTRREREVEGHDQSRQRVAHV